MNKKQIKEQIKKTVAFFLWIKWRIIYLFIHSYYLHKTVKVNTGKVALCCIAKMENDYIREFVDYYQKLGFDKLYLYDNNNLEGERFEELLEDYLLLGFVEIIDFRGKKICQLEAYQNCCDIHRLDYDWIAFFDCDEYLTFNDGTSNIHDFLNRNIFDSCQLIHVNWMTYGDNEMLDNDGRNVIERFKEPIKPLNFKKTINSGNFSFNNHIKTFVRGGVSVHWDKSPHTPSDKYYRCCTCDGRFVENTPFNSFDYHIAYLKHFTTKTIGEYVRIKMKRGFPDLPPEVIRQHLDLDNFFAYNKRTDEKIQYAEKLMIKLIKDY